MNIKNYLKKIDSKTSSIRIKIPDNLDLVLEGLIRKVLKEQPKCDELYVFAARYFEALLNIRDQLDNKYTINELNKDENENHAQEMIRLANRFPKAPPGTLNTSPSREKIEKRHAKSLSSSSKYEENKENIYEKQKRRTKPFKETQRQKTEEKRRKTDAERYSNYRKLLKNVSEADSVKIPKSRAILKSTHVEDVAKNKPNRKVLSTEKETNEVRKKFARKDKSKRAMAQEIENTETSEIESITTKTITEEESKISDDEEDDVTATVSEVSNINEDENENQSQIAKNVDNESEEGKSESLIENIDSEISASVNDDKEDKADAGLIVVSDEDKPTSKGEEGLAKDKGKIENKKVSTTLLNKNRNNLPDVKSTNLHKTNKRENSLSTDEGVPDRRKQRNKESGLIKKERKKLDKNNDNLEKKASETTKPKKYIVRSRDNSLTAKHNGLRPEEKTKPEEENKPTPRNSVRELGNVLKPGSVRSLFAKNKLPKETEKKVKSDFSPRSLIKGEKPHSLRAEKRRPKMTPLAAKDKIHSEKKPSERESTETDQTANGEKATDASDQLEEEKRNEEDALEDRKEVIEEVATKQSVSPLTAVPVMPEENSSDGEKHDDNDDDDDSKAFKKPKEGETNNSEEDQIISEEKVEEQNETNLLEKESMNDAEPVDEKTAEEDSEKPDLGEESLEPKSEKDCEATKTEEDTEKFGKEVLQSGDSTTTTSIITEHSVQEIIEIRESKTEVSSTEVIEIFEKSYEEADIESKEQTSNGTEPTEQDYSKENDAELRASAPPFDELILQYYKAGPRKSILDVAMEKIKPEEAEPESEEKWGSQKAPEVKKDLEEPTIVIDEASSVDTTHANDSSPADLDESILQYYRAGPRRSIVDVAKEEREEKQNTSPSEVEGFNTGVENQTSDSQNVVDNNETSAIKTEGVEPEVIAVRATETLVDPDNELQESALQYYKTGSRKSVVDIVKEIIEAKSQEKKLESDTEQQDQNSQNIEKETEKPASDEGDEVKQSNVLELLDDSILQYYKAGARKSIVDIAREKREENLNLEIPIDAAKDTLDTAHDESNEESVQEIQNESDAEKESTEVEPAQEIEKEESVIEVKEEPAEEQVIEMEPEDEPSKTEEKEDFIEVKEKEPDEILIEIKDEAADESVIETNPDDQESELKHSKDRELVEETPSVEMTEDAFIEVKEKETEKTVIDAEPVEVDTPQKSEVEPLTQTKEEEKENPISEVKEEPAEEDVTEVKVEEAEMVIETEEGETDVPQESEVEPLKQIEEKEDEEEPVVEVKERAEEKTFIEVDEDEANNAVEETLIAVKEEATEEIVPVQSEVLQASENELLKQTEEHETIIDSEADSKTEESVIEVKDEVAEEIVIKTESSEVLAPSWQVSEQEPSQEKDELNVNGKQEQAEGTLNEVKGKAANQIESTEVDARQQSESECLEPLEQKEEKEELVIEIKEEQGEETYIETETVEANESLEEKEREEAIEVQEKESDEAVIQTEPVQSEAPQEPEVAKSPKIDNKEEGSVIKVTEEPEEESIIEMKRTESDMPEESEVEPREKAEKEGEDDEEAVVEVKKEEINEKVIEVKEEVSEEPVIETEPAQGDAPQESETEPSKETYEKEEETLIEVKEGVEETVFETESIEVDALQVPEIEPTDKTAENEEKEQTDEVKENEENVIEIMEESTEADALQESKSESKKREEEPVIEVKEEEAEDIVIETEPEKHSEEETVFNTETAESDVPQVSETEPLQETKPVFEVKQAQADDEKPVEDPIIEAKSDVLQELKEEEAEKDVEHLQETEKEKTDIQEKELAEESVIEVKEIAEEAVINTEPTKPDLLQESEIESSEKTEDQEEEIEIEVEEKTAEEPVIETEPAEADAPKEQDVESSKETDEKEEETLIEVEEKTTEEPVIEAEPAQEDAPQESETEPSKETYEKEEETLIEVKEGAEETVIETEPIEVDALQVPEIKPTDKTAENEDSESAVKQSESDRSDEKLKGVHPTEVLHALNALDESVLQYYKAGPRKSIVDVAMEQREANLNGENLEKETDEMKPDAEAPTENVLDESVLEYYKDGPGISVIEVARQKREANLRPEPEKESKNEDEKTEEIKPSEDSNELQSTEPGSEISLKEPHEQDGEKIKIKGEPEPVIEEEIKKKKMWESNVADTINVPEKEEKSTNDGLDDSITQYYKKGPKKSILDVAKEKWNEVREKIKRKSFAEEAKDREIEKNEVSIAVDEGSESPLTRTDEDSIKEVTERNDNMDEKTESAESRPKDDEDYIIVAEESSSKDVADADSEKEPDERKLKQASEENQLAEPGSLEENPPDDRHTGQASGPSEGIDEEVNKIIIHDDIPVLNLSTKIDEVVKVSSKVQKFSALKKFKDEGLNVKLIETKIEEETTVTPKKLNGVQNGDTDAREPESKEADDQRERWTEDVIIVESPEKKSKGELEESKKNSEIPEIQLVSEVAEDKTDQAPVQEEEDGSVKSSMPEQSTVIRAYQLEPEAEDSRSAGKVESPSPRAQLEQDFVLDALVSIQDYLSTPTSYFSTAVSDFSLLTPNERFLDSERKFISAELEDLEGAVIEGPARGDDEERTPKIHMVKVIRTVSLTPRKDFCEEEDGDKEASDSSGSRSGSLSGYVANRSMDIETAVQAQPMEDGSYEENEEIGTSKRFIVRMPTGESANEDELKSTLAAVTSEVVRKTIQKSRSEASKQEKVIRCYTTSEDLLGGSHSFSSGDWTFGSSESSDAVTIKNLEIESKQYKNSKEMTQSSVSDSRTSKFLAKTRSLKTSTSGSADTEVWGVIEKEIHAAATKIQSTFRGIRNKLQRDNAIQISTDESSDEEKSSEKKSKEQLQSTGEFHDTIVLTHHPRH